jgi:hypothetical protein
LNPKFAFGLAANVCELRVRGTSAYFSVRDQFPHCSRWFGYPTFGPLIMPLCRFLDDATAFAPDDLDVMTAAFDRAIAKLGLKDRADGLNELVAKRIIALAAQGERDSEELCERALSSFYDGSATAAK